MLMTAGEPHGEQARQVQTQLPEQPQSVLLEALNRHRFESLDFQVSDIIDAIAALRGLDRCAALENAMRLWFRQAFGFRILELQCREQGFSARDFGGKHIVCFTVRLDANHKLEVQDLSEGQTLLGKYRAALVAALPRDLVAGGPLLPLEHFVEVSEVRSGSVEVQGSAHLGVMALLLLATGAGAWHCDPCSAGSSCGICQCLFRLRGGEGAEYAAALRELRSRGAEFELSPDGGARLRVPPAAQFPARWTDCCGIC